MPGAHAGILVIALAADRVLGGSDWLWRRIPHPIVIIGRLIEYGERRLNRPDDPPRARRRAGARLTAILLVGGLFGGIVLHTIFRSLWWWGPLAEAVLVAVFLAQRSLLRHVRDVTRALETAGLDAARGSVSHIVGRDVAVLDEHGVARGAIESLAENFSDGVLAPALWYLVAGLPGLIGYKILNTADSMIGYRNDRYADFGMVAARADDVANFIPARLSALLIAIAALPLGLRAFWRAIFVALRDAAKHKSPNAGWPECAVAGALGLALGGPRRYGEVEVEGAWLNDAGCSDATPADIRAALRLIDRAFFILLAAVGAAAFIALWPA